jgi:hypothetical protein
VLSETAVSDASPAKPKKVIYPADFEACWRVYPTDQNMSKSKALTAWRRLTAEDRALVLPSLPSFNAYCRKDPTYRPVHFVRYLSERRFEGFAPLPAAAPTDADWLKRLGVARSNRTWSTANWGPKPGEAGCMIPAGLIQPGDGEGWREYQGEAA